MQTELVMPLYRLADFEPELPRPDEYWIAPNAVVIGRVKLGKHVSIWFASVLRGDNEPIEIGAGSNVQDGCVMHTDPGFPVQIGEQCTIGHRAVIHGARIGSNSLVGMNATVLNGAHVGANSIVGANALVTEGREFPDNTLILGSPAKAVRTLGADALARIRAGSAHYVTNYQRFARDLQEIVDI
jgi:carbonic anhydrase/acetyltransferase-like protein (isoleucine patch superfamily)